MKKSTEVSPLMRELATYISRAVRKPLPKAVVEKTKHHVLDTIAAMVSGSRLLPGRKAISYVKTLGGTKEFDCEDRLEVGDDLLQLQRGSHGHGHVILTVA